MASKIYSRDSIILDGRMDEAVWQELEEHTGFKYIKSIKDIGGNPVALETSFKILPCEHSVIIGVRCEQPHIQRAIEEIEKKTDRLNHAEGVEIFLSPAGTSFNFYQFRLTVGGLIETHYYSETGNTQPDPYAPDWKRAIHVGEDYWSAEIEFPLSAFYMTTTSEWTDRWLINVCRTCYIYPTDGRLRFSSWCLLNGGFVDPKHYGYLDGFPMRANCDAVRISGATVDLTTKDENGYYGVMTVKTINPEAETFEFTSEYAETKIVKLEAGVNEFTVHCRFTDLTRIKIPLFLKRLRDGMEFNRFYSVIVAYEPIVIRFSLPEYKDNFYPGQDSSKIVGRATASKPITLTLEGPGIETQTITPNADGSFAFETPNFEFGDASITATIEGAEVVRTVRRLAPTGHMMTWISGGNLIVNGEAVLRRNMYAEYYHGGAAFQRKYDADDLHQTKEICGQKEFLAPERILNKLKLSTFELTQDVVPREEVFRGIDEVMKANEGTDFAYYYLCDEPECRQVSPIYLKHLYDYVSKKDPYHVILSATFAPNRYLNCFDWFEAHPYIVPQVKEDKPRYYLRDMSTMGDYIDLIAKLDRSDKCIGFIPTCFAYKFMHPYADYPTLDELICHTWAAMIHGGKSLYPYAYHDLDDRASLYEGIRYLFSSFEALDKLVLFSKRTVLKRTQEVEAVLYDKGDETMFVLVNFTQEPQQVTLESLSGTWHEFRHDRIISGNMFDLKPLEVIIGTSQPKDADLPTYAETAALIDKLESERVNSRSLLFNKQDVIKSKTSSPVSRGGTPNYYKLFDGIRDNLGWSMSGDVEKFYEIDMTPLMPVFNTVAVYGKNIDDMEIKVKNNDQLSVPPIAEVKVEEFSTTFVLKETISPECLRLEFHQKNIELYEIEVF